MSSEVKNVGSQIPAVIGESSATAASGPMRTDQSSIREADPAQETESCECLKGILPSWLRTTLAVIVLIPLAFLKFLYNQICSLFRCCAGEDQKSPTVEQPPARAAPLSSAATQASPAEVILPLEWIEPEVRRWEEPSDFFTKLWYPCTATMIFMVSSTAPGPAERPEIHQKTITLNSSDDYFGKFKPLIRNLYLNMQIAFTKGGEIRYNSRENTQVTMHFVGATKMLRDYNVIHVESIFAGAQVPVLKEPVRREKVTLNALREVLAFQEINPAVLLGLPPEQGIRLKT